MPICSDTTKRLYTKEAYELAMMFICTIKSTQKRTRSWNSSFTVFSEKGGKEIK